MGVWECSQWVADKDSKEPLYVQLVSHIKRQITKQNLPRGHKLPSVKSMQDIFNVSRNTVLNVLDVLEKEGVIITEPRKRSVLTSGSSGLGTVERYWGKHLESGLYLSDDNRTRTISLAKSSINLINISECRLGEEFAPDTVIKEALTGIQNNIASFTGQSTLSVKGIYDLRHQVSSSIRGYGINASPSNVLISQRIITALELIFNGLITSSVNIYVPTPGMTKVIEFSKNPRANIISVKYDEHGPSLADLKEKYRSKENGIFYFEGISFPNMVVSSSERVQELYDFCSAVNMPVIENDWMREYWFDKSPAPPMKSIDVNELVLYIFNFTRGLSPSFSVAALVGHTRLINRLTDAKIRTELTADIISQMVVREMLKNNLFWHYMNSIRDKMRRHLLVTDDLLRRYMKNVASWKLPKAGNMLWVKLSNRINMNKLLIDLEHEGILVYPGDAYDEGSKHYISICYTSISSYRMELALSKIAELIGMQLSKPDETGISILNVLNAGNN